MILATITKRKKGFCVQIRRKGYTPISRTFATRADAHEWALEEECKRASPRVKRILLDPRKATLRDVLTRYLSEITPTKISRETEHYRIAKIVRAPIADLSLFDLTTSAIAHFRDERLMVVKAATVCRELHLIKQALNTAKREWDYTPIAGCLEADASTRRWTWTKGKRQFRFERLAIGYDVCRSSRRKVP